MKKYVLPLVLTSVVVLQACNEQAANTEAVVATPASALESPEQRLSYGIAFGMGQRMQSESMPVDVDAFGLGLRDAPLACNAAASAQLMFESINETRSPAPSPVFSSKGWMLLSPGKSCTWSSVRCVIPRSELMSVIGLK